jgi:AcrR family transcriptional regulator
MNAKVADTLRAAEKLFQKHGLRRVSVEEICRLANVSKRTYYKKFSGKNEVAIEVLTRLVDRSRARFEEILTSELELEEKISTLILARQELAADCSSEFLQDALASPEMSGFLETKQAGWDKRMRAFYMEAQQKGQIRENVSIEFILFMAKKLRDLVNHADHVAFEKRQSKRIDSMMRVFFYGILSGRERS